MAEDAHRPILNPVLRFLDAPTPGRTAAGGKAERNIKDERLNAQRDVLANDFRSMADAVHLQPSFNGHVILYADMFEDSFAPSYTPNSIFNLGAGALITAPYQGGYLLQVRADRLIHIAEKIESTSKTGEKVDISRVERVRFFGKHDVMGGRPIEDLWSKASELENGHAFTVWLMRLRTQDAVVGLINKFDSLRKDLVVVSPEPLSDEASARESTDLPAEAPEDLLSEARNGDRIALALVRHFHRRHARSTMLVPSIEKLDQLVASGSVFRIDPVVPITAHVSGGADALPSSLPPDMSEYPIVGMVDGGLSAPSYFPAVAWRASDYTPTQHAALNHGNQVASQIIHGHECNKNLVLPELHCRIGVAQAVARPGSPATIFDHEGFLNYLDVLMGANRDTRVWNYSMNFALECLPDFVDPISHEIAVLARKYEVLPVISIGNGIGTMLKPPADCEAAVTVGGRLADLTGESDGECPDTSRGPGPAGMLKPELANFSNVQVIGGLAASGSSFSAALTSPVAAHAMTKLKDATPDMVKALLVHSGDIAEFDPELGFGTPSVDPLPWECEKGVATLLWTVRLQRGLPFHWTFPIPPSFLKTGKLKGRGALTAILNPHPLVWDGAGLNYFGARVETAFQVRKNVASDGSMETVNLLGPVKTKMTEHEYRRDFHKWSPTKHHKKSFNRGSRFGFDCFRVYARLFTRDLYLAEGLQAEDMTNFDVAFVLSLDTGDKDDDVYSEMVRLLGASVESAVIDSDFDIEAGNR